MPDEPHHQIIAERLDQDMSEIVHNDIAMLRNAVRTEQARSDLLWEMAHRRGYVSDEEASVANVRAE